MLPVAQGARFGRYEIVHELAAGGMGMVYLGRMRAGGGVSLTVAIKRINPALGSDPRMVAMFLDEARITSIVRHPNVVQTLDVVEEAGELLLVMEYVHGVSLARLLERARARGERLPFAVASRIASDVLHGLSAAHDATNERGEPLDIVHRDVSPQNVLVGVDGVSRVADFGIARAANRAETTRAGEIKGKLRYIAPEQFEREAVDRRADIYGVGLLLWEMLAGASLRRASAPGGLTSAILAPRVQPPSSVTAAVPPALDDVVVKALAIEPRDRFPFAPLMAVALEEAVTPAPYATVGELVRELAHEDISERKLLLERLAAQPPAEVTPIAPTSMTTIPSARIGRRRQAIALVVGGLALAALALTLRPRTRAISDPGPTPTAAASTAPAPSSLPLPGPSTSSPVAAALPSSAPLPPASPAVHPAGTKRSRTSTWRAPPPKPDCTIPYVVDRKGIRVPRPECM